MPQSKFSFEKRRKEMDKKARKEEKKKRKLDGNTQPVAQDTTIEASEEK